MRLLDRNATDKEDVRHMTHAELDSLGITVVDRETLVLQCKACGQTWVPRLGANGKLPFDYWLCPRPVIPDQQRAGGCACGQWHNVTGG
jgi:hypothetical protein